MASLSGWIDQQLLKALDRLVGSDRVRFVLNGSLPPDPPPAKNAILIRVRDRETLTGLLLSPEMTFGDAFSDGRIYVEGDLLSLLEEGYKSSRLRTGATNVSRMISRVLDLRQRNTPTGSRRNIHRHYDLDTQFYKLWLDPELVYTCAYFPDRSAPLEEAQRAKFDIVCRKVWLRPGETVVEAGCGWGALARYMARQYGVRVKAFNISHEQISYAREAAKREGLASQVEFIEDDYRNLKGRFDAFVSVGMLEHVGLENYHELGSVIRRVIGDSGRGLLHFIGKSSPSPLSIWIRRRIFPGGYAPTLGEALGVLEPFGFSVIDVENLRRHYARTIEHWLQRFDESQDAISERFGSAFTRMWRLYLAGSIAAFRVGTMELFQVVFAGTACKSVPWTRDHLSERAVERRQDELWTPAMS